MAYRAMTTALTAWSYSRYAAYETCPLAFKLRYIDKEAEPPNAAMERGAALHKALEKYIGGTGELPTEIKTPFQQRLYAEMRAFPDKVIEEEWAFTRQWKPTGWRNWKEAWLRAKLDVGLMYEDLTFEAVDHKSGKKYGSNDEQMEIFALAALCQFKPATHVTTRLVYIDSGDEEIAEFPATVKEGLKTKWEAKVQPMFADTVFAPRPNEKCRVCHFSRSKTGKCRFG